MTTYKYACFLSQMDGPVFDELYPSGAVVVIDGIHRCKGCGRRKSLSPGERYPAHEHFAFHGQQRWFLVVAT